MVNNNENANKAMVLADQALADLAEQLDRGHSEALSAYLKFLGRFWHYSALNCLLLQTQRPNAIHFASYAKWQELGRQVRRGERGLAIMAPVTYRRKVGRDEPEGETEENRGVVTGFRTVHVFAEDQTDGPDLPTIGRVTGNPGEKLQVLRDLVAERGIELAYSDDLGGARGASYGGRVELIPGMEPAEEFATLVHEVAHELLHRDERRVQTTVQVREVEAEAVAFVVTTAVGLTNGTASADYLGLYGGDAKLLAQSLSHIQRVAAEILDRLL